MCCLTSSPWQDSKIVRVSERERANRFVNCLIDAQHARLQELIVWSTYRSTLVSPFENEHGHGQEAGVEEVVPASTCVHIIYTGLMYVVYLVY